MEAWIGYSIPNCCYGLLVVDSGLANPYAAVKILSAPMAAR